MDVNFGPLLKHPTCEVTSFRFDSKVVVKYAYFPWKIDYFEEETAAYKMVEGHQICPKFLGHLTEHGRVMGIIIEYIDGHPPTIEELPLCQQALAKLHKLGFLHGDMHKHQFIIHDGKAVIIDIATLRRCDDPKLLREEFQSLEKHLLEDSDCAGRMILEPYSPIGSIEDIFPEREFYYPPDGFDTAYRDSQIDAMNKADKANDSSILGLLCTFTPK
ncbi:MAG: hypothetical protein M1829_005427 [Trizodia sp. TS-e1964]|nr:MAG: hypothetical protein M1829_005427 [Trizodia sp. TS-e1964]